MRCETSDLEMKPYTTETFRELLRKENNAERYSKLIRKPIDSFIAILAKIDGLNYHDWFNELANDLSLDQKYLLKCFLSIYSEAESEEIDSLSVKLDEIL